MKIETKRVWEKGDVIQSDMFTWVRGEGDEWRFWDTAFSPTRSNRVFTLSSLDAAFSTSFDEKDPNYKYVGNLNAPVK